jgi:hypothetical protein
MGRIELRDMCHVEPTGQAGQMVEVYTKEHERDLWLFHAENSIEAGHVVTCDNHICFETDNM